MFTDWLLITAIRFLITAHSANYRFNFPLRIEINSDQQTGSRTSYESKEDKKASTMTGRQAGTQTEESGSQTLGRQTSQGAHRPSLILGQNERVQNNFFSLSFFIPLRVLPARG